MNIRYTAGVFVRVLLPSERLCASGVKRSIISIERFCLVFRVALFSSFFCRLSGTNSNETADVPDFFFVTKSHNVILGTEVATPSDTSVAFYFFHGRYLPSNRMRRFDYYYYLFFL